jgi:serine/threonine-protein kinase HipA
MRQATVYFKGEEAGILAQQDDGSFLFQYAPSWMDDHRKPAISLTLPKTYEAYRASFLFPFFYNLLPEGSNKQVVCQLYKIDRDDYFGLLLTTATNDTIGAVTVRKL